MRVLVRADLHIHSNISDGEASPKEVVQEAYYKGLNVISITDHDTFQGSIIAQRYSKSYNITVLIGAEIATDEGDILVYCVKPLEVIPKSLRLLMEVVRKNPCIIVPAHPFDEQRNSIRERIFNYKWDAIETFNLSTTRKANERAKDAAKILGVPGIGNSDAHTLENIGKVYNEIRVHGYNDTELILQEIIIDHIRRGFIQIKITRT